MAIIHFGNSTDLQHLSVLLICQLEAIGNRSQQKFTFLCIRILGKGLSLFYVSFFSDLSNTGLVSAMCIEFDEQKFISCIFVGLCTKVSCNWKTTWCYFLNNYMIISFAEKPGKICTRLLWCHCTFLVCTPYTEISVDVPQTSSTSSGSVLGQTPNCYMASVCK